MKISGFSIPTLMVLSLILWGCGGDSNPSSPDDNNDTPIADVSFSAEVLPILALAGCAASDCHGDAKRAGMSLIASEAYDNLVDVNSTEVPSLKRVLPGDAENSYMVVKIEGRQSFGSRMPPPPRAALSSRNIRVIRTWIDEGAQDN